MSDTKTSLEKHTAAPVAAGFCYQFQRAIVHLSIAHNGDSVGIETLDDIVVSKGDGSFIFEQDKTSTREDIEVYGDRSENLFNTLTTWLTAALKGEIDITKIKFYLVSNRKCTSALVNEISCANSEDAVERVVEKILVLDSKCVAVQRLHSLLSQAKACEMFKSLCLAIELVTDVGSDAEARSALPIPGKHEKNRDIIYKELLGWVQKYAFSAWNSRKPCIIEYNQFLDEMYSIMERLERETKRELPEHKITLLDEDKANVRNNTFVRQVRLVSDDVDLINESIEDYLRCMKEKMRLSEEGEITDEDWVSFDDELKKRWRDISRRNKNNPLASDRKTGERIMNETLSTEYRAILAGVETMYSYMPRGSYHRLSDTKDIGWHPNYKSLLGESFQ